MARNSPDTEILTLPGGRMVMVGKSKRPAVPARRPKRQPRPQPPSHPPSPPMLFTREDRSPLVKPRKRRTGTGVLHRRETFVSLEDAAKRADLQPNDLAALLVGRVTMRVSGKSLELNAAELDAALPRLKTAGLLQGGSKPAPASDTPQRYGVHAARRHARNADRPRRVPSLRPWAED